MQKMIKQNFNLNIIEIKKETKNIDQKTKKQKNALYNIEMLYKTSNKVTEFVDDYSSMVSEAKLKVTKGRRLKILTPKQMFQRLTIALAQVKADNNSQSLLNENRQIIYSLYRSTEINKSI